MRNNLIALQTAFENAGVILVADENGRSGVLLSRLRLRAYIPGEGLNLEINYADSALIGPDSAATMWFRLDEAALIAIAHQPVRDEAHAKAIARSNEATIVATIEHWIEQRGPGSRGGGPRVITVDDLIFNVKETEESL